VSSEESVEHYQSLLEVFAGSALIFQSDPSGTLSRFFGIDGVFIGCGYATSVSLYLIVVHHTDNA